MTQIYEREFLGFPRHSEIKEAALGYISDGDPYLARNLRATLASVFELAPAQLALRFAANGRLAFENYVDHVLRAFTREGIHTGPNGGQRSGPEDKYYVTDYGLLVARKSLAATTDKRRNGAGATKLASLAPARQPTPAESKLVHSAKSVSCVRGTEIRLISTGALCEHAIFDAVRSLPRPLLLKLPPVQIAGVCDFTFLRLPNDKIGYADTAGLCMDKDDLDGHAYAIMVPDRILVGVGEQSWATEDPDQSVMHEIGHLLTPLLPGSQVQRLYLTAVADAASLNPEEMEAASYFLTPGNPYSNRVLPEPVAELFAVRYVHKTAFGGLSNQRARQVFNRSLHVLDVMLGDAGLT
jgi:hypothetical protein